MKEYVINVHVSGRFANVDAVSDKIADLVSSDGSVVFEGQFFAPYADGFGFKDADKLRNALTALDGIDDAVREAYRIVEDYADAIDGAE